MGRQTSAKQLQPWNLEAPGGVAGVVILLASLGSIRGLRFGLQCPGVFGMARKPVDKDDTEKRQFLSNVRR